MSPPMGTRVKRPPLRYFVTPLRTWPSEPSAPKKNAGDRAPAAVYSGLDLETKRKLLLFAFLAVLAAVVLVCVGSLVIVLFTTTDEAVEPAHPLDRTIVVTIEAIAGPQHVPGANAQESLVRRRGSNDELIIEYTYEDETFYISNVIAFEPDLDNAEHRYEASRALGGSAFRLTHGESREPSSGFTWGDECDLQTIRVDGNPVGHAFLARSGAVVMDVVITGRYFEDRAELASLLRPFLERASEYNP